MRDLALSVQGHLDPAVVDTVHVGFVVPARGTGVRVPVGHGHRQGVWCTERCVLRVASFEYAAEFKDPFSVGVLPCCQQAVLTPFVHRGGTGVVPPSVVEPTEHAGITAAA